jgi:type I restriction enzyme S subunit
MTGYSTVLLREACSSVEYGYTASSSPDSSIGPHFLRITDIASERLDWATVPFCAIETNKLAKYRLRTGDIVIARTGATTGWAKYIKEPPEAVFASYLVRIRPGESVDARYIGFIVESSAYKDFIQQHMGGAAQPNANAQVLTSFEVPLPPLPIQHRIAGILSAYDDLIENNQRRIKILEEMARRLYREWFVTTECVFTWPEVELGSLLELKRGYDLPERDRRPGNVPIISSSGFTGAHDSAMAKGPGLVTGRYGTLGQVFLVWDDFWPLNTALYVKDLRKTPVLYAYWLLRHVLANQSGSAAAVPGLNRNHLHALKISAPPASEMQKFQNHVEPLENQTRLLGNAIQNLRRTRDLLLPRLLSGQIDMEALPEPALFEQ